MVTASTVRDLRDVARANSNRQKRDIEITAELLNDLPGLEAALKGCAFFLAGGDGEAIEGLPGVLFSPQAKGFMDAE